MEFKASERIRSTDTYQVCYGISHLIKSLNLSFELGWLGCEIYEDSSSNSKSEKDMLGEKIIKTGLHSNH